MADPGVSGLNGAPEEVCLKFHRRDGSDGDVLLQIAGEVDLGSAAAFRAGLHDAIETARGVVILDMAEVTFMDSAGIEQLVRAREDAGGRLRVSALHPSVQRVLEMTALLEWFPFRVEGADAER